MLFILELCVFLLRVHQFHSHICSYKMKLKHVSLEGEKKDSLAKYLLCFVD